MKQKRAGKAEAAHPWVNHPLILAKIAAARKLKEDAMKPGGGGVLSSSGLVLRETKRKRETPVCGGLFKRTGRVWEIEGTETGIESPTPQMYEKEFTRFVERLEEWADATEALQALMKKEVWPLSGAKKTSRLQNPSRNQVRLENRLCKRRIEFENDYEPALNTLVCIKAGSPYFNLEFYPRSGKELKLFRRFVDAILKIRNKKRLNLQGPDSETHALDLSEQGLAETMRRRGKGTERGSCRIIASAIADRRNVPLEKEGQMLPALIQDVKRHFRRKGFIHKT